MACLSGEIPDARVSLERNCAVSWGIEHGGTEQCSTWVTNEYMWQDLLALLWSTQTVPIHRLELMQPFEHEKMSSVSTVTMG